MTEVKFEECKVPGYAARTRENVAQAHCTIAIAHDFTSAGEKLTRSVCKTLRKPYFPVQFQGKLRPIEQQIDRLSEDLYEIAERNDEFTINIAGNGIYTLRKYNRSGLDLQQLCDHFTHSLLEDALELAGLSPARIQIRSGGQTGFDEAGIQAGRRLDVPVTILAPQGWTFRGVDGIDVSDYEQFVRRFTGDLS